MAAKSKKKREETLSEAAFDRAAIVAHLDKIKPLIERFGKKLDRDDLLRHLDAIRTGLTTYGDKNTLRSFMQTIAKTLRSTDEQGRPEFTRVKFFLWVVQYIPDATHILPLLDDVEWCPETFMRTIKAHYKNPKVTYKSFENCEE